MKTTLYVLIYWSLSIITCYKLAVFFNKCKTFFFSNVFPWSFFFSFRVWQMEWDGAKWKKKVFVSYHWEMWSSRSWHKTHSSKSFTLSCTRYALSILILYHAIENTANQNIIPTIVYWMVSHPNFPSCTGLCRFDCVNQCIFCGIL